MLLDNPPLQLEDIGHVDVSMEGQESTFVALFVSMYQLHPLTLVGL